MMHWMHSAAAISVGLLVGRLVVGLGMAAHGAQKLFGWFGGHGRAGTGGYLESLGFRPGKGFATAAGAAEFCGGLLVALGLFGPLGPALMVAVMVVAIVTQHRGNGFFAMNNGFELPLLYATGGVALAFTGPGAYSLDAALGIRLGAQVWVDGLILGIAILGALASLAARRPAPAAR
jgi:putative oxidoreductase